MTRPVRNLYNEAKNNKVFQGYLKKVGQAQHTPTRFWGNDTKVIYATVYMGWLIALGQYDESKYK